MKLLDRASLYYLLVSLVALAVGSLLIFFFIRAVIIEELDEYLLFEKEPLLEQLRKLDRIPIDQSNLGDQIRIQPIARVYRLENVLRDTLMYDAYEKHPEPYRHLQFEANIRGKAYRISIFKSLIKRSDLVRGIVNAVVLLVLFLLMGLFLLNRWISRRLWKPFYATIDRVQSFDLSKNEQLEINNTDIEEFKALNEGLKRMTSRIADDYHTLKEFTENASHEIQTPLSVIKTQLERLIQRENLGQQEMGMIQSVYEAASRLSWLNRSLLLLSRIENRQYLLKEPIRLANLIERKVKDLEDYADSKGLTVEVRISDRPEPKMDPLLADILVNNLINNAIKHNIAGGRVTIELSVQQLFINNTGDPPAVDTNKLFNRFQKGKNSDSLGLGLSIVRAICQYYGFHLTYLYTEGIHTIQVIF